MQKTFKIITLYLAKYLGLFRLSKFLTRYHLRVLCYHGISYKDEHEFRPKLFMRPETFSKRWDYLSKCDYNIVSLSYALENPAVKHKIALTMDDGWSGTYELIYDVLKKHKLPLTLYLTSYYAEKNFPVVRVLISYILWSSKSEEFQITLKSQDSKSLLVIDSTFQKLSKYKVEQIIIEFIHNLKDDSQKLFVIEQLAELYSVNIKVDNKYLFRLLDSNATKLLILDSNLDIQLHTHRHYFPRNEKEFVLEIQKNREWIKQFRTESDLVHFCYPSGEYSHEQLPFLAKVGIQTAVTTTNGLFEHGEDRMQIPRICDGENVTFIEFQAEISGFVYLIKKFFKK